MGISIFQFFLQAQFFEFVNQGGIFMQGTELSYKSGYVFQSAAFTFLLTVNISPLQEQLLVCK